MIAKLLIFISLFTLSNPLFAITVDWTSTHKTIYSFGSFSGADINNNDILEFDELTAFSSFLGTKNNLAWLNDFGDFDLKSSTWVANADRSAPTDPSYDPTDLTWFTYNDWHLSFYPLIGTINYVNVTGYTSTVPVPTAVWLFGSGLLGLIGVARRKKA